MYINEVPYEISSELCRLLDMYDYWKELAGNHMEYSPFDINEIQQVARHYDNSPTYILLIRWGHLIHKVEELFILLYRMKHVPALRCLTPLVDRRFHRKLNKLEIKNEFQKNGIGNENDVLMLAPTAEDNERSITTPAELVNQYSTSTQDGKPTSIEEKIRIMCSIPVIAYEKLRAATDDWSEGNLLGEGGFGQVFKGELQHLPVAVKRLRDHEGRNKELIGEMCLNEYRHDNILPLYGYSFEGPKTCLVYQLMLGGSLEQRLRGKTHHSPLSWPQRRRIAHGVASGLQYLHNVRKIPLIHGDIKPANILLDQYLMPKIGDFGLARNGPEELAHIENARVIGTRPYLPDEYFRSSVLSPAVDVFSFGVVLLEMATALPPMDKARSSVMLSAYIYTLTRTQMDFATLEDPMLRGTAHSNPQLCRQFIELGLQCTRERRQDRPSMLEAYKALDTLELPGKLF